MKLCLKQRAGEMREAAGALLEKDKQNEASLKVAEQLQAQPAAQEEGSYLRTLGQRCEELQVTVYGDYECTHTGHTPGKDICREP